MTAMCSRVTACLLALLVCTAAAARPPNGPYEGFRVKTDNVPQAEIDGWYLPAGAGAKGTVFVLHGYNNSKERVVGWEWIRDREGWDVIMFDFREHGASTKTFMLSTIGYHEIWDVKAVVDWAEKRGTPKPYLIYGRSMGAATGLRWASMDRRISGVLAVSPFKNAELATRQIADYGARLVTADKLGLSRRSRMILGEFSKGHLESFLDQELPLTEGVRKMLREVDIPRALRNRNDLRVWIMAGQHDSFPEADQHEIINASASPPELKRLVIAPGANHRSVWAFGGAAGVPSHDQYVREFLAASLKGASAAAIPKSGVIGAVTILAGTVVVAVLAVLAFWIRQRLSSKSLSR